ncbi:hypothetical protein GC194_08040, partial [bacterium]|nr:hypothetical protein [bacterium]
MRWLAFLLITGFLAGCKNNLPPAAYHPSVLFEKEIKFISRLNLTKILGDTLQLSNGQTTKRYAISYNPKTKINEVIELGS